MTLTSLFGKVSKRAWAVTAIAIATIAIPAGLLAWGPGRTTYTMAHPADKVTFNSITDNPVVGDERNFVQIRNVTTNSKFTENVNLVPGNTYEVYVFYHNDAASNLNDKAHNYKGIATGAYMKTDLPASVSAGATGRVNGYVGATNATPSEVWDEAYMKNPTAGAMDINIVSGSAKITNNGKTNGKVLSDKIFSTGTALGYDTLDGKVPGCTQYSGYVTYKFTADQPNFTVSKTVSKHDANSYVENVDAKAGDLVDFKIQYKNTGSTQQDNVVIRDSLPKNLSYVAGSTYVSNGTTNGWKAVTADTVTKQGVNIQSYNPGAGGFIKFTAKVAADSALACGTNKLTNTASADTPNGSKSDTASVTVKKTCTPPAPKQVKACDVKAMKIVTIDENKIDGKNYTTDLTKCVPEKTVKACDIAAKKIVTVKESQIDGKKYTTDLSKCETKPAPKQVKACDIKNKKIVTVTEDKIDGKTYTTDLSKCETKPAPKQVQACDVKTKKIVTIDESKVDGKNYTTDLNKCCDTPPAPKQVKACEVKTMKIVTVSEDKIDGKTYTTDLSKCETKPTPKSVEACNLKTFVVETVTEDKVDGKAYTTNLDKCKSEVCRLSDKEIVTISNNDFDDSKYTTDLTKCETTPETPETPETPKTPTELPHTGIADGILSVLGLGSLVGVTSAYVASRRRVQ